MASVHDVLFRLLGDDDDARQSLEEITAELEAFSKIHAQAEADLDIGDAQDRLRELRISLERLDATTSEPKISTDIAGVLAQIEGLSARLEELDHKDVTIDVDVKRGITERLASITGQVSSLGRASKIAEAETGGFFSRIARSAVSIGPFTTQLQTAIPLVMALAAVIVSLAGAVGAMAASFGAAVLGLGALAVAFGGVLVPAIALGYAAFKRFKDQSDVPGTAAHALSQAFQNVGDAVKSMEAVADPLLRALADAVGPLLRFVKDLGPAFTVFGRNAAGAIEPIVHLLKDSSFEQTFSSMISLGSQALKPLVKIGTTMIRIFTNIADAAMPILVDQLQAVVKWLNGIGDSTSNIARLRSIIGVLVDNLKLWLSLVGSIASVFINFAKIALPFGQDFVGWLQKGVQALADWLNSTDGVDHVQRFFEDTLPLAKSVVSFVGKLVLAFIQLGQFAAPIVKPIVDGLNALLDIINFVLEKLNHIPGPIRQIIGVVITIFAPIGKVRLLLAGLILIFGSVGKAAVAAFNAVLDALKPMVAGIKLGMELVGSIFSDGWRAIKGVFETVWRAIKSIVGDAINGVKNLVKDRVDAIKDFIVGAWDRIKDVTRTVWDAVKDIVEGAWDRIKSLVSGALDRVKSILSDAWDAVKNVAQGAWDRIKDLIISPISAVVDKLRDLVDSIKSVLGDAWDRVKSAAADAFNAVKDKITGAIQGALDWLANVPDKMFDLGKKIMQGLWDGLKSLVDSVKNAISGVVDWITSKVNLLDDKVNTALDDVAQIAQAVQDANNAQNNMPHGSGRRGKVGDATADLRSAIASVVAVVVPSPFTPVAAPAGAATPTTGKVTKIEQNFYIPPGPAGKQPDARHTAAQLSTILRQRGGA